MGLPFTTAGSVLQEVAEQLVDRGYDRLQIQALMESKSANLDLSIAKAGPGSSAPRKKRRWNQPSPPKHTVLDSLTGISEKAVDKMADDYKRGYASGSHQRVADEVSRKEKR